MFGLEDDLYEVITKASTELERSMKLATDRKEYKSADDMKRILEILKKGVNETFGSESNEDEKIK